MKKFLLLVSSFIIIAALGVIGYLGLSDSHQQLRASWTSKDKGATRSATALAMEFEKTHVAAIFGNAKAQYKMGHYMVNGRLGFKSPEKAVVWYKMAAKQGHARAQLAMARYCFTGEGTEQNDAEGAKWLKLAAEGGQAEARGFMGTLYLGAIGVKQDLDAGMKWLKDAKDSTALQRGMDIQQKLDSFAAMTPEERKAATAALATEVKAQILLSWAQEKADLAKIDDTTPGDPDAKK